MRLKEMVKAAKNKEYDFPEDAVCRLEQIEQSAESNTNKEKLFVELMDELLTEQQRLLLWEHGGSCTGGETGKQAKLLSVQLAGKPLHEKIALMNDNPYMYRTQPNEDGTITAFCGCHCLQKRFKNPKAAKRASAYGCAAGAAFYNLKTALGVRAKIISIDYPQDGDGKKHMTFTFEVAE